MKNTYPEKDWTKGSILGNLWSLSWPMIISSSFMMIGPTIDMIWVGRLGSASIAGVGVSGMVVMFLNSVIMGFSMGTRAMIARFIGAGDRDSANVVVQQAFVVFAGFALFIVPVGIFLSRPILVMFGLEADVVSEGVAYMRIMLVGAIFMSFCSMNEGVMQAAGDSKTPMKIAVLYRCVHIALCPFLIFGWWIFPRMGVSGAAVTNVISQGLGLILGLWVLFSGRTRLHITLRHFRFSPHIVWRIVKIGIPASISSMQRSLGQIVLMWFIAPFGTFAVAAHTVCQRAEMFVMMPGMGLGMGAGVLAGQNLGALQPERAERSSWLAAVVVEGLMVLCASAMLIWPEGIIRIFAADPQLIEVAGIFLRIAAVGFLIFGLEPVFMSCLNGVGDTLPPMLTTIVGFWLIQIPLAYYLPRFTGLGVYGIRWGMAISMIVMAIALAVYFRLGRWKNKKV